MNKKLYKSNSNKIIEGVCGGIADYFGIDRCVMLLTGCSTIRDGILFPTMRPLDK